MVDLLTDWDNKHKPYTVKPTDLEILASQSARILLPGGVVTIVEVSDPAPYKLISKFFRQAGLVAKPLTDYLHGYTNLPYNPGQYLARFEKSAA